MLDQFGDDFGIGFWFEYHSFALQKQFDIFVIGNDTIMYADEVIVLTGSMWVRIQLQKKILVKWHVQLQVAIFQVCNCLHK